MIKYLYAAAALMLAAALAGTYWGGHHVGYSEAQTAGDAALAKVQRDDNAALDKAQADARAKEQASVTKINAIEAQHAQELQDANAKADSVIADLRAGNLRLRKEWRCPASTAGATPAAGASVAGADADADLRAADSGALVRIGAAADAQIRALQAIVTADRQQ